VTEQWAKVSREAAGAALVHSTPRTPAVWTASSLQVALHCSVPLLQGTRWE
jgi:hypothetical protein